MKFAAAICFGLFFSPLLLTAQTADQHRMQAVTVPPPSEGSGCPVSMHAEQTAWGNRVEVDHSHPKGVAQLLHLTLTSPDSTRIAGATITVHGLTPQPHAAWTPLASSSGNEDSLEAVRTLTITFSAGPGKEVS